VLVSDLYAMNWKAVADRHDFVANGDSEDERTFDQLTRSAYAEGTLTPDVVEEQRRLLWADVVVLQYPIWWYGMPAILKGWVDRVYAFGFAYGIGPHGGAQWGKRFGEGTLVGRRAMVAMTVGGRMTHYGPRGVNGAMDDVLWPVEHGVLFYPGFSVLPPAVYYEVGRADADAVGAMVDHYVDRLLTAGETEPIPMRPQNSGDYDDLQVLRPGIGADRAGHALHQREPVFVSNTWLGAEGDYTPSHIAPDSRDGAR